MSQITEFKTVTDTSYNQDGETVNEEFTSIKVLEFLEVTIEGDSLLIVNFLDGSDYEKSLNGDTVAIGNKISILEVDYFPYADTKYELISYYIYNNIVFSIVGDKYSSYEKSRKDTIMNILVLFIVSFVFTILLYVFGFNTKYMPTLYIIFIISLAILHITFVSHVGVIDVILFYFLYCFVPWMLIVRLLGKWALTSFKWNDQLI